MKCASFPLMKHSASLFLCIAVLLMPLISMDADGLTKEDFVEIETIVFHKSEHGSEDLMKLIDETFARIRRGEDFRALAAKVSDNPMNYKKHFVDSAMLIRPIQKAVKRLDPGETS